MTPAASSGTRAARLGVLALVPEGWDDTFTRRHQVLMRLAKQIPIVWLEPPKSWREHLLPSGSCFLEPDRWSSPFPGLDVMRPGWRHPLVYRPRWLASSTFRSRLAAARRRLLERGVTRIVLYVWRDEFAEALDLVEHDISCYHIDDEYSFAECDTPTSARETHLIERVSQVVVHSPALLEKKGGGNPHTALIPNGVDFASYSSAHEARSDLAAVPFPRIGYAGVIKKQLDLALMVGLARARPNYSFVFVGPILNVAGKEQHIAALKQLPNVHFLGSKPPDELPAYVQHFDVCLMCYEVNDYTKYIYPLKLNEYLAAGRPTVSSPIDAVRTFDSVVTLARTEAEWLAAVDAALGPEAMLPAIVAARRDFARAHEWDALVERLIEKFREAVLRIEASGAPLMPTTHTEAR